MKRPLSLVPSHGVRRSSRRPVSLVVGVATALLAGIALVIASPLTPASPVSATSSGFGCGEASMATFALGDGTSVDPYIVTNSAQLAALTLNNSSVHYRQECDLDLVAAGYTNWPGIGTGTNKFQGVYDGNSKTISNVSISVSTAGRGLFNQTSGSAISNLSLDSVTIRGATFDDIGGLIGVAFNTSVSSVTVSGLTMSRLGGRIGGLIGNLRLSSGHSSIEDVSLTGSINATRFLGGVVGNIEWDSGSSATLAMSAVVSNLEITSEKDDVGGVIGRFRVPSDYASINLSDVSASGSIKPFIQSNGNLSFGGTKVGGLIGNIDVDGGEFIIASGFADVSVSATSAYVGGLIGRLHGAGYSATISSSVAYGDVTGSSQVGGLIGEFDLGTGSSALISDAEAHGAVSTSGSSGESGGLVGRVQKRQDAQGVISGSTASGAVSSGGRRLGGLVGRISGPGGSFQIESSSASGSITGSTNVGGLVGFIAHEGELRIADSYASGNVTSSDENSSVGGLIGSQVQEFDGNDLDGETTIARTYSTGSVTGNGNVGGLIGLTADATVCASFWDLNTSGQATSAGGSGAVGKSTTDMKKLSTFSGAGWSIGSGSGDSSKIWGITENTSYPVLIWPTQGVSGDCEQSGSGSGNGGGVTSPGESGVESTVPPTTVPPTSQVPVPVSVGGVLPALAAGEVVVYEDGVPVVVEVFVDDDTELVVLASTFELRLSGECSEGCAITTNDDGRETLILEQEGLANVTGVGFEPGSSVYVWLFSEPRFLGELTVNADGTFAGSVALGDVEIGEHTLQVNGVSQQGSQRSANLGVVVDPLELTGGVLPTTGSNQQPLAWLLMIVMLTMGAMFTRWGRRPYRTI
jgi:hypothetical protein